MDDLTGRLVRRLRDDGRSMSRNKNFHTFAEPKARRALRIVRHLRDLEADLLSGRRGDARSEVIPGERRVAVRLEYPELRATRTAYLSQKEYAMLLEDPGVSACLV